MGICYVVQIALYGLVFLYCEYFRCRCCKVGVMFTRLIAMTKICTLKSILYLRYFVLTFTKDNTVRM
jgi:hypothetical protein